MEKLNRLISQSISFWSFPNGNGASHLISQILFLPQFMHRNRFPRYWERKPVFTEHVFFSERKYFAKSDCTLRSATIIVYMDALILTTLYLQRLGWPVVTCGWPVVTFERKKKTKLFIRVILSRYHVTFCGSHVVIFVLVWGSAELQISNDYSAENIDKHVFTAQNLILSSGKACPDDQYGQSESGVFHYHSPIRDWLRMLLGWT